MSSLAVHIRHGFRGRGGGCFKKNPNHIVIVHRQLFTKNRSTATSNRLTSFERGGGGGGGSGGIPGLDNNAPRQFGPPTSSWGTTVADLGPVPRTFYVRHESTILRPRHSGAAAWAGLTALTGVNLVVFGMWNNDSLDEEDQTQPQQSSQRDEEEEWMMENFTTNVTNATERPWTLFTSSISHKDAMHMAGNMFALWLFGFGTYRVIGAVEFAKVYVLGGIACSSAHVLQNVIWGRTQPPLSKVERDRLERLAGAYGIRTVRDLPPTVRERVERADKPSLGASGSVMAVSAVAAALFPLDRVRFNARSFFLPLPVAVGMFVVSDLIGITQEGSPTDHAGHLGGLAFGALYAMSSWRSGRWGTTGTLPIIYRFKQMMHKR